MKLPLRRASADQNQASNQFTVAGLVGLVDGGVGS